MMRRLSRRNLRRLISYHEAGHAVAARKLGVEITSIDMTPDDVDRLGNVQTRTATGVAEQAGGDRAALARGLYIDLMVTLAGPAAQKLAGYPEIGPWYAADINDGGRYASRLARIEAGLSMLAAPDEPGIIKPGNPLHTAGFAIIKRAEVETITTLKDNWQAVVRVAGALSYHDRLTLTDLDDVIDRGQRGRQ
jgi:hypothetical protein